MNSQILIHYVLHYEYLALYLISGISVLGAPIPAEFVLSFAGFLSFKGEMNPFYAVLSSVAGSVSGMTISYYLGLFFEKKVLSALAHKGNRLDRVFGWYHRHEGKLLLVGYYIPVVYHISGYIAGISRLKFQKFILYASIGAVLWAIPFFLLGFGLGSRWKRIVPIMHQHALIISLIAGIFIIVFYLFHQRQSSKR